MVIYGIKDTIVDGIHVNNIPGLVGSSQTLHDEYMSMCHRKKDVWDQAQILYNEKECVGSGQLLHLGSD